ncbi:MAG: hypothetical protein HKM93_08310 [Desulfobacteraceae bacterium]|nr:hypothetical protein [Desulfobacteraceae bacterium]
MPKKTPSAQQIEKHRFWKAHIDSFNACDLNQTQYCRKHQLKFHQFVYWKKKFFKPEPSSAVSIVEVPLPRLFQLPKPDSAATLKVDLGHRYKVEVNPGFDPTTLKQLIVTLGAL